MAKTSSIAISLLGLLGTLAPSEAAASGATSVFGSTPSGGPIACVLAEGLAWWSAPMFSTVEDAEDDTVGDTRAPDIAQLGLGGDGALTGMRIERTAPAAERTRRRSGERQEMPPPADTSGPDAATGGGDAPDAAKPEPIGLGVDLGVASLYGSRGLNVFQATSRQDAHVLVAPSISYAHESGFDAMYGGCYQANGDNRASNVEAGIGNEQDVVVGFGREVIPSFTLRGAVGWIFYPFANAAVAGTAVPTSVEPQVEATWASVVDVPAPAA